MLDVRIEESVTASPEGNMKFRWRLVLPFKAHSAVDSSFVCSPVQDSFDVEVCYLGQEVLKRHVQGSDLRIMYLPSSPIPPTPAVIKGRFPRILLPDPPSSLPTDHHLFTLLPFMQHGVVLTSMTQGVYGKRFCQGRVFWTGPHMASPGPHKLDQNTEPVLLFSKDAFRQREESLTANILPSLCWHFYQYFFCPVQLELNHFLLNGGEPPQCGITLCFGEELTSTDDPSLKHIILKVNVLFTFLTYWVNSPCIYGCS